MAAPHIYDALRTRWPNTWRIIEVLPREDGTVNLRALCECCAFSELDDHALAEKMRLFETHYQWTKRRTPVCIDDRRLNALKKQYNDMLEKYPRALTRLSFDILSKSFQKTGHVKVTLDGREVLASYGGYEGLDYVLGKFEDFFEWADVEEAKHIAIARERIKNRWPNINDLIDIYSTTVGVCVVGLLGQTNYAERINDVIYDRFEEYIISLRSNTKKWCGTFYYNIENCGPRCGKLLLTHPNLFRHCELTYDITGRISAIVQDIYLFCEKTTKNGTFLGPIATRLENLLRKQKKICSCVRRLLPMPIADEILEYVALTYHA